MVTDFAFDFRNTAGFVTDPGYAVAIVGTPSNPVYPTNLTNANGDSLNCGYQLAGNIGAADRNSSNDVRLAGINYNGGGNTGAIPAILFEVALPSAGTWSVQLAAGDASSAQSQYIKILDNTTPLATYTAVSTSGNSFMDASGNVWTQANFFASQVPLVLTFSSTLLAVQIGPSPATGTLSSTLAFLRITFAGVGPDDDNTGQGAMVLTAPRSTVRIFS